MFKISKTRNGLREHAFIITTLMASLVSLLGIRAYIAAKGHFMSINDMIEQDVQGQALLVKIENLAIQRDHAQRKSEATHDAAYESLAAHHEVALARLRDNLSQLYRNAYPELVSIIDRIETPTEILSIRQKLETQRHKRLIEADHAALGILRLILLASVLSIGIGLWLFQLFFRGLLRPMRELRQATHKIKEGDLSSRIPEFKGVAELEELGTSFNAMAERLEQAEQAKADFLATVSHEFKNPLAALKEGLSLLSTRGDALPPEAKERAFAACMIASKRLESMMNNLMQHARMEKGFFDFDFAAKDLGAAIETAIKEVTPVAERKNMQLLYEGNRSIPAAFNWDGMIHVFENVLLNAIKYGAEKSSIKIRATQQGDPVSRIDISILNIGRTLGLSEVTRVFERFYRGENASKQQGLGLGLHVVKRIVEAHHGDVSVESVNDRTEFRIWIPGRYEKIATLQ